MRTSRIPFGLAIVALLTLPSLDQEVFGQGLFNQNRQQQSRGGQRTRDYYNDGYESEDIGSTIIKTLPGLLDGLSKLPKPSNNNNNNNNNFDDDYRPPRNRRNYDYYEPSRPVQVRPAAPPPPATPQPNKLPPKVVEPEKNQNIAEGRSLTKKELEAAKDQIEEVMDEQFDQLEDKLASEAQLSDKLQKAGVTPAEADRIAREITDGRLSNASEATLAGLTPPLDAGARDAADAWKELNDARDAARDGKLTATQLADLDAAFDRLGFSKADSDAINNTIADLGTSSTIQQMLIAATPDNPTLPTGNDNLIALLPTLPPGTIISLGGGMVLISGSTEEDGPTITTGCIAEMSGLPIEGTPAPDSTSKVVTSGTLLLNNADVEVNYVVNGSSYTMKPGFSQPLAAGTTWVVEFDKGDSKGQARYTLSPGTYAFEASDKAWELYRQSYDVTIDNSASSIDFHYVLNEEPQKLAAGEKQQHKGDYPLMVRFDDGNGAVKQKKLTKGELQVGVDIASNTLDLLDATTPRTEIASVGKDAKRGLFGPTKGDAPTELFGKRASRLNRDDAPWRIAERLSDAKRAGQDRAAARLREDRGNIEPGINVFGVAGQPEL
ncbi:MAG: hypothetical protein KF708_17385 [Pirellulales bacterium]|nr:hypothetical protein [Pirellulales bacterium]